MAYQRNGKAAFEVNRGGRPEGAGRILQPEEEAEIRETIVNRLSKEFRLPVSGKTCSEAESCTYLKMEKRRIPGYSPAGAGGKTLSYIGEMRLESAIVKTMSAAFPQRDSHPILPVETK